MHGTRNRDSAPGETNLPVKHVLRSLVYICRADGNVLAHLKFARYLAGTHADRSACRFRARGHPRATLLPGSSALFTHWLLKTKRGIFGEDG